MPPQAPAPNPTDDYRPYKKGPNFGLIVVLSCVAIIVVLIAAIFFFHTSLGKRTDPYKPNQTPNSSLRLGQSDLRVS